MNILTEAKQICNELFDQEITKEYIELLEVKTRILPDDEIKALIAVYKVDTKSDKGIEARNKVIMSNVNLVWKIVHKLNLSNRFNEDNFSIGILGIVKAIDNYDLTKARGKFSSYLFTSVKGYILNSINTKDNWHASLDVELKGKDGDAIKNTFKDKLVSKDETPSEIKVKDDDLNSMRLAIANLPEKESLMIKMYFGLLKGRKKTYEQIGKETGMSKMGVQKAVKRIIKKLSDVMIK